MNIDDTAAGATNNQDQVQCAKTIAAKIFVSINYNLLRHRKDRKLALLTTAKMYLGLLSDFCNCFYTE